MLVYDADDRHSVALCAVKEARGDGDGGIRCVLHVIANRVGQPGFGKTVHDVVYGKNQFSSMSVPSDPQFNWQPRNPLDVASMRYAMSIVDGILQGGAEDLTKGAKFYEVLGTNNEWFDKHIKADPVNHPETLRLGHQVFYL